MKSNLVLSFTPFIHQMDSQDVLVQAANNMRLGPDGNGLEVGASRDELYNNRFSGKTDSQ